MASVVFGRQVSSRVGRYVWSLAPKADMELGEEVGNAVGFPGGIRGST